MDPQIEHTFGLSWWVAKRYREAINQLELAGDEIGLHTHAWRWEAGMHRWIADHGDQKWINHCIRSSFGAYRTAFGRSCLSFRFGDRWMNDETMDLLEFLGVKFDLTVEPGRKAKPGLVPEELHTGSLPDYTATPTLPYRPSRQDFRKPGHTEGREMWLIPLSTDKGVGRFARVKRAAKALGIDLYEADQLNLGSDRSQFRVMMNSLLNVRRQPYLAPVMRTDALLYSKSRANIEQNLNFLLSHSMGNCFQFVGPAEAIKLFK
ncbi:MAG: hypothetical protein AABM67_13550 [Acidobacteriota bacterium]